MKPINQNVILHKEAKETTEAGIYVGTPKESNIGIVYSAHKGSSLKKGDEVAFKEYGSEEVEYKGKKYYIVDEKNILAIVE